MRNKAMLKEALKRGIDPKFWFYRLRWNIYPKLCIVPGAPVHVDVELTNACNLRCITCIHGQGGIKDQGFMGSDFAKYLIDQLALLGTPSIKLNWRGEATLHKELPELIRYAKQKGILEVQLNTNGIFKDKTLIEKLINSGLDRIIFSVDGATKEVYENIRKGGRFEDVADTINKLFSLRQNLKFQKPFIRIQMVRISCNEHEEKKFIEKWSQLSDEILINDFTYRGQKGELRVGKKKLIGRIRCMQPWKRIAISWDGGVYPCCADYYTKYLIGDAKKEKLIDIWNGSKMKKMREYHKKMKMYEFEPCASCFLTATSKWKKSK